MVLSRHFIFVNSTDYSDIAIIDAGHQVRLENHSFGPVIRDRHILHYITEGEGTLQMGGRKYKLKKGDLFYIPPVVALYSANKTLPYTYYFIGLRGDKIQDILNDAGLTETSPVKSFNDPLISEFMDKIVNDCVTKSKTSLLRAHANLYLMLAHLCSFVESNNKAMKYSSSELLASILYYIDANYSENISIQSIANHFFINRNYLSTLFHKEMGTTLVSYLINYRIKKACELLITTEFSIKNIADLTGFSNQYNFSKRFTVLQKISPKEYRRSHKLEKS